MSSASVQLILDEEIRQITELKRMATNPHLIDLMRQIVAAADNDTGRTSPQPAPKISPQRERRPQHTAQPTNLDAQQATYLPNGLTKAVREVVVTMGKPFTIGDVVDVLQSSGFKFVAGKPKVAVAAPLKIMEKRNEIRCIKRGSGSEPHVYEATVMGTTEGLESVM